MAKRSIEAALLLAFVICAAGCSGDSADAECQNACQRVVSTCASTNSSYGYSFSFAYASFGYGLHYGGTDLQQCLSDCAAVTQPARSRIAECVINASDCMTVLHCR